MGKILSGILLFVLSSGAAALDCSRPAGSLPDRTRPAGARDAKNPIEHVIVIMQENHSFDQYFGNLTLPQFYGSQVDGLQPGMGNPDATGKFVPAFHETTLCAKDPQHGWDAEHLSWNGGAGDGFVKVNGPGVLGYFDHTDLNFYYDLANKFAIADHYYCSAMTQTFPNRFFLLTGSAFGHIKNDLPATPADFAQKTIFETLNDNGVSWKYYCDGQGYVSLFQAFYKKNKAKTRSVAAFARDLKNNTLPAVAFIDSNAFEGEDEHPSDNVQVGQVWVAARIQELMKSAYWKNSVLFLTYDENGGFFDHVSPPAACQPDNVEPVLAANNQPGHYDRYGFRVPLVAVSPYVKHHYVSHGTYDHSSILKFIETKFNLPALTARDANADAMLDLFDFDHPVMTTDLVTPFVDPARKCP